MFWRLSKHPDGDCFALSLRLGHTLLTSRCAVEKKLLDEIDQHVGDAEPTLDRVKDMDYADALFSEVRALPRAYE